MDKGHCKIAYETEDEQLEFSEYYDFSSSYPTDEEHDGDDTEESVPESVVYVSADEGTLTLPSGARIGNRSLRHIYKQNLPMDETKESVLINQLAEYYDANAQLQVYRTQQRTLTVQRERKEQAKHLTNNRKYYDLQVGVRHNMLQKHFRNQIGFST
jgi:pre-60S factor REI1